jgi:hypothetical protein
MASKRRSQTAANTELVRWRKSAEPHDYPAAESYLRLLHPRRRVAKIVAKLRSAPITHFRANDIFRASELSLLGISNSHVERDREKIRNGIALSPLLLLRNEPLGKVIIADGYHRLCAVYAFDENALIPCKIV